MYCDACSICGERGRENGVDMIEAIIFCVIVVACLLAAEAQ
jgi:hypothetical protein